PGCGSRVAAGRTSTANQTDLQDWPPRVRLAIERPVSTLGVSTRSPEAAIGPPQALAAAKATTTIPIVFVGGGDPVEISLVKSLAHPGGNVTGLTLVTVELAGKRVQLVKEAVPAATRVAILWNPINTLNKLELNEATKAGKALGLTLLPIEIRALEEFE